MQIGFLGHGVFGAAIGSLESRNFQYGKALVERGSLEHLTAEGVGAAEGVQVIAKECGVVLPLALAVRALLRGETNTTTALYDALGFVNV